ncbi:MAG TPA: ATP-binding cassette domain-containing protein [Candidatus Hydrogenedentes bacterium]|nr:ATP-binding cassette domain-containing protein [Candidatus Hydrogenedentota bacterium]
MTDAIRIDGLTVNFGGVHLFSDLTLAVAHGEKTTLTGPSGSGKSTLLRCIMGFAPCAGGNVFVNGENVTHQNIWQVRGQLAYVAQEPELGEGMTRDALTRPFSYRINRRLAYDEQAALRLFAAFLLPVALLEKPAGALSGGEKQRVALIAALLLQRPILLLDEAASALDNASKQAVRDYLCARDDLTILSVSHDIREFALSGAIANMTEIQQETPS